MGRMRIGVLTGGGDVPGLNSAIKGIVEAGVDKGYEVIGICRGWEGLTHVNLEDPGSRARYILPLDRNNTRTIDRTGGTFLHTSRTNPKRMKAVPEHLDAGYFPSEESSGATTWDLTERVLRNLEHLGMDALVAIGGDDTLSYASVLHQEGVRVVAIPKTMDNDVRNTEYCIGFSTAITRAVDSIQRQRSTIGSHERIGIFRIFGRDAGYTALYTAYVTGIRCGIPEHRFDLERMMGLLMKDRRENPSNYALVVLSEGCTWSGYEMREYGEPDAYGHRKKANVAEALGVEIRNRTGLEIVISDLTYDLRSGEADFIDKMVAVTFAHMAVESVEKGESGLMTAIDNGRYRMVPIPDPGQGPRQVEVASLYNTDQCRPRYSQKAGKPVFLCLACGPE